MLNSTYETPVIGRAPFDAGSLLGKVVQQTPLYLFATGLKAALAARRR